jgi:hypothetical protein
MLNFKNKKKNKRSQRGQGISEYAAVIAFVCVLIAMAFQIAHGTIFSTISESYSSCQNSLSALNAVSQAPSH